MIKNRWRFSGLVLIFLLVVAALVHLPNYLLYADKPLKSEVVVLFVGDDWDARQKKAAELITDGYAGSLIIPAFNKISRPETNGILVPVDHDYLSGNSAHLLKKQNKYPRYYEDTHFEVLEARRIMQRFGMTSAIFVSSPYHMRRIKIITGTVFKEKSKNVCFIPTITEKKYSTSLERIYRHFRWISQELIKIAWFETYSGFSGYR